MLVGYRVETDGVLDFVLTAIVPAGPRAERARSRFLPDGRWQQQRLERIYERSGRRETYLGDWHSHPGGAVRPSRLDRKTYVRVARDRKARTPYPLIVITNVASPRRVPSAWVLRRRRFRLLDVIET